MTIIIVGQTGSGKTTLANALVKEGYERLITYTTRPKRKGEVNGVDYHFVTGAEFRKLWAKDYFAEWSSYDTVKGKWYYGSAYKDYAVSKNKVIVLNPEGVEHVLDSLGSDYGPEVCIVFLDICRSRLFMRLRDRGDSLEEVYRRLSEDQDKFYNFDRANVHIKRQGSVEQYIKRIKKYVEKRRKI